VKFEIANALRHHPIVHVDRKTLIGAVTAIEDYQFLVNPPKEAWTKAIELSYGSQISPYDSIFLGLAHALGCKLVTADNKLIGVIPSSEKAKIAPLASLTLD
jgi:predicted nucleic acid-binding protein